MRVYPDAVDAQQALASVALSKRDFDQLAECAEALIRLLPSSALGYTYRAAVKASRHDLPGVEADLTKAIDVAPKNPLGHTRMGELRSSERRFKEAEAAYEEALQDDPSYAEALRGLVRMFMLEKEPGKALARVNEQIAKAPNNSDYYLVLGQLLANQKELGKAEVALQKSVELNKNNIDAFLILGAVQAAQGEQDRAIATYLRSVQENPRDIRSSVQLGVLEEQQGNWQKAQELYQRALDVEPDYPLAANNLAYSMLEHGGNVDVALSLAQTARRGMLDSPYVAGTLAWAYYKKGFYANSIDLLQEALRKVPDNPDFNYHIGVVYQRKQDRVHAIQHFQRLLKGFIAESQFGVLLPQISFQNFGCGQKSQDGDIATVESRTTARSTGAGLTHEQAAHGQRSRAGQAQSFHKSAAAESAAASLKFRRFN